jgi:dienelactone hydrolase
MRFALPIPLSALVALFVAGCAAAPPLATLSQGTTGTISFQSLTFPGHLWDPFMPPLVEGKSEVVSGTLTLPSGGGPFPAIVLTHGCSGVSAAATGWATTLTRAGIAVFVVDSFGDRYIREVCTGREHVNIASILTDVYRALELVGTHPRIDPSRIGIMGLSFGGRTAVWASQTRFQARYGSGRHRFAAYLAFYPASCFITLADEAKVSGGPIRIFIGTEDDWTPVAQCRQYVDRLRRMGTDVTLFEYPGAYHAFDNTTAPASRYWAEAFSARNCAFIERDGRIVDPATGKVAGIDASCMTRGVHFGHNPDAYRKAVDDVRAFLRVVFKMP